MSQVYRVGRDRENDIVLDDATVSRAHAELRMEGNGDVLLVDLGSTNGTCVRDGNKWIEIDRATVDADERILIGDIVTTVDALFARRDDLLAAYRNQPARDHNDAPAPANDAGRAGLESVAPEPAPAASPEPRDMSLRDASRRIASDFARLVFRPGRAPSADHGGPSAPVRMAGDGDGVEPEHRRRTPTFRGDRPDEGTWQDDESPSLIARRIGQQIGKRERLPSLQIEANPARRVEMSQTRQRRWLKPAVLSAAASMALVAAIAAVAVHGPDRGSSAGPTGATARGGSIPGGKRPDPVTVAGRPGGAALPAGMFAYGGPKIDSFRAVAAMKDGGYLAVGSTESGGAGGFDLWLVRIDRGGAKVWEKRYGGTGDDYGLTVAATEDGGAIVGGAADGRRFIWILRVDDKGGVRWSRRIDAGYRGHVTAAVGTRDGFAVTAVTEAKKGGPTTSMLLRLDTEGGTMWRRDFGPTYTWISSVQATYGAFVVAGVAKAGAEGPNALWVEKVDQMGKTLWSKRLAEGSGRDAEAYARMARRGDIIVATTHQTTAPGGLWPTRHARIVRLDKDGKVTWRHVHIGSGRERVGGMVLVKGGILLAGTTSAPAVANSGRGKSDLWLAKVDTSGKTEWERRFGGAGADGASGFAQVGQRGFVLVGTTDAGAGRGRDGLLVAVDRAGRIERRSVAKKE